MKELHTPGVFVEKYVKKNQPKAYEQKKMFRKGENIAVTITLDPRNFRQTSPKKQHSSAYPLICKMFKHIGYLTLYVELQQSGQVHYHGWLLLTDHIKLYKMLKTITEQIGIVKMKRPFEQEGDERTGVEIWNEYISKDQDVMEELLGLKFPLDSREFELKKIHNKIMVRHDMNKLREGQLGNILSLMGDRDIEDVEEDNEEARGHKHIF